MLSLHSNEEPFKSYWIYVFSELPSAQAFPLNLYRERESVVKWCFVATTCFIQHA